MKKQIVLGMILTSLAPAQTSVPQTGPAHAYVGAGGCTSSNCHGGTTQLDEAQSRIYGNEYATWFTVDKHALAFQMLGSPRSKRMAELLGITDAAASPRCTVCHAVGSPQKSLSDGVACEACHGPASDWLGSHFQVKRDSPNDLKRVHADSVNRGMTDTKDLDVRARTCLACHLGEGSQLMDHEFIAAGHPDLAFELVTFSIGQPAHHRPPKPTAGNTLPQVRAWAVGQSRALAEGMRLLALHAANRWPEFSDLECYQCHHDLRLDSWRIGRGYDGRKAGSLQVNLARFDILRSLVEVAAPGRASELNSEMSRLADVVSKRFTDGAAIAEAAKAVLKTADRLTSEQFASQDFNELIVRRIILAIDRDIQRIADSGVNSAEQATMSLDALASALSPQGKTRQEAIDELYNYLEHPSVYQPAEFMARFRKAAAL